VKIPSSGKICQPIKKRYSKIDRGSQLDFSPLIRFFKFFFRNFGNWTYEGAVITRGLWELQDQLPELDLEPFLHR
jgi:hypothetical protein